MDGGRGVSHWPHCSHLLFWDPPGRGEVQYKHPFKICQQRLRSFLKPPWQAKSFLHMNFPVWVIHMVLRQNYKWSHALDLWLTCSIYEISNVESVSAKGLIFLTITSPFVHYSGTDKFQPLNLNLFLQTLIQKITRSRWQRYTLISFLNSHLKTAPIRQWWVNPNVISGLIFETHSDSPNGHSYWSNSVGQEI